MLTPNATRPLPHLDSRSRVKLDFLKTCPWRKGTWDGSVEGPGLWAGHTPLPVLQQKQ